MTNLPMWEGWFAKSPLAKSRIRSILKAMLQRLTKTFRFKAAIFLAVLYAFTVLAPHAAMAFGNPQGAAHCLTASNMHDHASVSHKHADGIEHTHAAPKADESGNKSDENGPAAACCGLFSATGIPAESRALTPGPVAASTVSLPLPDLATGQGPDRINRPPIA